MKRILSMGFIVVLILGLVPLKLHAQTAATQGAGRFYVAVKAAKQGQFKSEGVPGPAGKDQIPGIRFSMQLTTPTNLATGQRTGNRQYSPVTFTKLWGPSSGQFLLAANTNETLLTVTFEFFSVALDGKLLMTQSITLTNANVVSIKRYIGVPMGSEPPDLRELEDISFTFQKIEFHDVAGTTITDDWSARM